MCLNARLEKIRSDCVVRKQEGFMINRSLAELNKGMSIISKEGVSGKDNLPIYFEKNIYPYCRKNTLDYYTLDKYYAASDDEDNWKVDMEKYGVLLTIAKRYFKLGKENFIEGFKLFTLLKVNSSFFSLPSQRYKEGDIEKVYIKGMTMGNIGKKNNPPNPPYVNIDGLKYIAKIYDGNDNQFKKNIINLFFDILKQYPFYQTILESGDASIDEMKSINNKKVFNIKDLPILIKLIDFIERNNSSTLIGTYENTDLLQTISFNDAGCSFNINNISNPIKDKINEVKDINFVDIANLLNNISNREIKTSSIITTLESTQDSNENDHLLYELLTHNGKTYFSNYLKTNFSDRIRPSIDVDPFQERKSKKNEILTQIKKEADVTAATNAAKDAAVKSAKAAAAKAAAAKAAAAKAAAAKKKPGKRGSHGSRGGQNTTFKKRTRKNITLKN